MQTVEYIQNYIYELRGEKVLLDRDLAALYSVETRVLNQAVKRNLERFPSDFMFQFTAAEWQRVQQFLEEQTAISSQFVMTYPNKRPISALPYAFTEQGIAMLSGVLKSDPDEYRYYAGFCGHSAGTDIASGYKRAIETNQRTVEWT